MQAGITAQERVQESLPHSGTAAVALLWEWCAERAQRRVDVVVGDDGRPAGRPPERERRRRRRGLPAWRVAEAQGGRGAASRATLCGPPQAEATRDGRCGSRSARCRGCGHTSSVAPRECAGAAPTRKAVGAFGAADAALTGPTRRAKSENTQRPKPNLTSCQNLYKHCRSYLLGPNTRSNTLPGDTASSKEPHTNTM